MNTFKKVMARPAKIQKTHQPLTQDDYDNLFNACKDKNVDILEALIPQLFQRSDLNYNSTNQWNETLLMTLFEIPKFCNNNSAIIKQLIEKMSKDGVNQITNYGVTALMAAFRFAPEFCNNNSEVIQQLIEKMDDNGVSQKSNENWTALIYAFRYAPEFCNNNSWVIEQLIKKNERKWRKSEK